MSILANKVNIKCGVHYDILNDVESFRLSLLLGKNTKKKPNIFKFKQFDFSLSKKNMTLEDLAVILDHLSKRIRKFDKTGK